MYNQKCKQPTFCKPIKKKTKLCLMIRMGFGKCKLHIDEIKKATCINIILLKILDINVQRKLNQIQLF